MSAYAQWGKDQHAQSARSTVKPPNAEQAITAAPRSLKEEEEAAAALRREHRVASQNAIAAQQDAERQADAAKAAAAKAEQQADDRQKLLDEHPIGYVPAPRGSTDNAKIARAAEFVAMTLGNIELLLSEIGSVLANNATIDKPKRKNT